MIRNARKIIYDSKQCHYLWCHYVCSYTSVHAIRDLDLKEMNIIDEMQDWKICLHLGVPFSQTIHRIIPQIILHWPHNPPPPKEQSHSREANSRSASQEIPRILQFLKIHYTIHNSPPLDPTPCQMNPVHIFPPYFFKVHCNDNSVGIALGYGLDDRDSRIRFPAGAGNFSLHHRVQNGSVAHPASYTMGIWGSFPGGKATGT
jgi:hypothetical protein